MSDRAHHSPSPRCRFTSADLDARAAFPANLALDLATNERGLDLCGWG